MSETSKFITSSINNVFDPRIIEDDGSKQLWNSDSVELAIKGLKEGYKLKENPFLKTVKGVMLRKANLPFKYSDEELEVIDACISDKIFFGNNFTKLKDGDKGWVNIKLRSYQENLLRRYDNNRWNIILFPRQSGKTTTTIIEIVHFLTFNIDKDCVVIAQSDKVVNEILSKIRECFSGLPFFMQPGFISFNKKGCTLDNGCRLSIGVASESVVQGFSLDLLYIDEFAYIRSSMSDSFWANIYPTLINNTKSRCIITSTPNGRNLFWKLWNGAIEQSNKFVPYRIYWYDVPGRDEQFKKDTIANVGHNGWLMGFECSFDVGLKSIFSTHIQRHLRKLQEDNIQNWSVDNYEKVGQQFGINFLKRDIFGYNLSEDYFLLSIDISEGLEQDYSIIKFRKIIWSIEHKRLEYKTIGVYRKNDVSVEEFAYELIELLKHFDLNKIKIVVENNNYGGEFFAQIDSLYRNMSGRYNYFKQEVFAKFMRDSKKAYERGIRWNHFNKNTAVKSFSNLVSNGIFEETYSLTIEEYLNFGKIGNSYAASYGHDDLTMSDVTAAYFIKSGDMFAEQWLKYVETELRDLCNDETEEIKKAKLEELNKIRYKYRTSYGFELQDHAERLKNLEHDDIFIFDI